MKSLILIASLMCSLLILIAMVTQFHKKELKESFNEQTRFSKTLLELEQEDPDSDTESSIDDEGYRTTEGCDCQATERKIFKVDKIEPDQTTAVQFVDDVKMNNTEVAGTLTIKGTQFATFDATSNKLIIG